MRVCLCVCVCVCLFVCVCVQEQKRRHDLLEAKKNAKKAQVGPKMKVRPHIYMRYFEVSVATFLINPTVKDIPD